MKNPLPHGRGFSVYTDGQLAVRLNAVFVGLNHLFYHLATDGTSLLSGEVAVVTLLQVYANFASCLHLELVECLLCCLVFHNSFLLWLSPSISSRATRTLDGTIVPCRIRASLCYYCFLSCFSYKWKFYHKNGFFDNKKSPKRGFFQYLFFANEIANTMYIF